VQHRWFVLLLLDIIVLLVHRELIVPVIFIQFKVIQAQIDIMEQAEYILLLLVELIFNLQLEQIYILDGFIQIFLLLLGLLMDDM